MVNSDSRLFPHPEEGFTTEGTEKEAGLLIVRFVLTTPTTARNAWPPLVAAERSEAALG